MAGQLLLIVVVAVVVHTNALPQPTVSLVPYKTYPSLAPYHFGSVIKDPRDSAIVKSRPLRNNGDITIMPRKQDLAIDPRDTAAIKSRPLRNKSPGFTPQPREPGFTPQPRKPGFTPQPRKSGFTPQPRVSSFNIQPKDTVSIKTRPLRLTYAADFTLKCKKKKQVATVSPGQSVQFSSINYPSKYSKKSKCKWQIKGTTDTTRISVSCDAFELQKKNKKGKCGDYLGIGGVRYCGTDYPVYSSASNSVSMFFKTNKKKQYSGFTCTATAYDDSLTTVAPTTEVPNISTTEEPTGQCSCGRVNRATRIVGGVETEVNEYPWMVALAWSEYHSSAFCGGSIINKNWILTAAHCADVMSLSNVVVAGEHTWSTESETSATQKIAIEQILMHPNYNSDTLDNDIALIKLASPLTFDANNNVAPVCPPDATDLYENVDAIVTGWGTLESGGSQPDSLQSVVVPTMTNSECQSGYGSSITDNMLCAGYDEGGKDSCQGDSGGPLVTADGSIHRQIGVVSWGYGCAYAGYPGVYSRVNNYLEWVSASISGTSWCDAGDVVGTSGPDNTTPEPAVTTAPPTETPPGTCTCGQINRSTRIVGGVETEVNEYPWMVALAWSSSSSNAFCGASIINERWILTASHCADVMSLGNVVVAGEHLWSSSSETSATQTIAIEQILMHPNYNSGTLDHDVALVKLASPLTFDANNNVAPICPPDATDLYANVDAIVTGWGTLSSGGDQPDALQEVVVPTMTNSECESSYGSWITDNMLCAGYDAGGKDSCQGDSGGPLITADGSIYRQIGVVSWGSGCADAGYPGVYARVNNELEWITDSISGTSWCDAGDVVGTSGPVNTTPEPVVTTDAPTGTCSCGRINRSARIVGGVETEVNEYPWMVALAWSSSSSSAFCGASIINERWILTASHCADVMSTSNVVVVGEHIWSSSSETGATQKYAIEEILMNPNYNSGTLENDVALIKLTTTLTFDANNKVAPVCPPDANNLYENVDATVTGWGTLYSGGDQPDALQEVVVPTMTNSECESSYGSWITDDMLCAGFDAGGKDSCQGDSGGPLITADGSIYRQIGVVSWGSGCADAGYPGVYARVTSQLDWIASSISGTSWCDAGTPVTSGPTEAPTGDCKCGRVNRSTRIINGQETEVLEYPWQAGLVSYGYSRTWCGGSLINSKWVITAAHCTDGTSPSQIQVLLGEHTIYDTDATEQRFDVSSVINHESYNTNPWTNGHDISLLELSSEVDFSSTQIRPICLPSTADLFAGAEATVTGFGTTEGGSQSLVLMEVDIPVVTNAVCEATYGSSNIDDTMICAGEGAGNGACMGDSGGPLITSLGDYHVQIGVVSFGSANCDALGVYARVTALKSWIDAYAMSGNAEVCSP